MAKRTAIDLQAMTADELRAAIEATKAELEIANTAARDAEAQRGQYVVPAKLQHDRSAQQKLEELAASRAAFERDAIDQSVALETLKARLVEVERAEGVSKANADRAANNADAE